MKEKYLAPDMKITEIEVEDVVTASEFETPEVPA